MYAHKSWLLALVPQLSGLCLTVIHLWKWMSWQQKHPISRHVYNFAWLSFLSRRTSLHDVTPMCWTSTRLDQLPNAFVCNCTKMEGFRWWSYYCKQVGTRANLGVFETPVQAINSQVKSFHLLLSTLPHPWHPAIGVTAVRRKCKSKYRPIFTSASSQSNPKYNLLSCESRLARCYLRLRSALNLSRISNYRDTHSRTVFLVGISNTSKVHFDFSSNTMP